MLAVTDPDGERGRNISAFVVEKDDEGFDFGAKERKLGIKGSVPPANCTSRAPASRPTG